MTRIVVFIVFLFMFSWNYAFSSHANNFKEKHFLHCKFAAISSTDTFLEFSIDTVVDEMPISNYNSDWMGHLAQPPYTREWFLYQMRTLSNCTDSPCSELHVFQRIIGCEVEKSPNGSVMKLKAFDEYGFDGEDLISFNSNTVKWVDKNPKAKEIKKEWNKQKNRNQVIKGYLQICMDWITTFKNSRKSAPNVQMFARKAPDDQHKLILICLVTDFFPREVEVNIRLNKSVLKDITLSETRPTPDGSFQLKASVKINRSQDEFYDCYVIHSSLTKPLSILWDGKSADNKKPTPSVPTLSLAHILSLVLVPLVLVGVAIAVCILKWRQKRSKEEKAIMILYNRPQSQVEFLIS